MGVWLGWLSWVPCLPGLGSLAGCILACKSYLGEMAAGACLGCLAVLVDWDKPDCLAWHGQPAWLMWACLHGTRLNLLDGLPGWCLCWLMLYWLAWPYWPRLPT